MRVPIGIIGVIYEARPNVTADAGALCIKSGNVVVLRGIPTVIDNQRVDAFNAVMKNHPNIKVLISLGGIPGFLMAAWLVERWGRKPVCVVTLLGGGVMGRGIGHVAALAGIRRKRRPSGSVEARDLAFWRADQGEAVAAHPGHGRIATPPPTITMATAASSADLAMIQQVSERHSFVEEINIERYSS